MAVLKVETSPDSWANQHDLEQRTDYCPKCGVVRTADIPFATKGYRGLMSDLHDCGESYRLRIFRPVGEEIKRWAIKGR